MAPAVLAACSTGTLMPAAASSAIRRSNSSSWRSVYSRSSSCRRRRRGGGSRPLELEQGLAYDGGGHRGEVLGRGAHPVHAGVHLHVHGDAPPAARAAAANAAMPFARVQRRGEPVFERAGGRLGAALAQQQDGRGDAVFAQLDALVDERDRQRPAPPASAARATAAPPCP